MSTQSIPLNRLPIIELPEPMLRIDFMRRFTMPEYLGIKAARESDDVVGYVMDLFDAAATVRLDHRDTVMAVGYFEQVGLLTEARAAQILDPAWEPS